MPRKKKNTATVKYYLPVRSKEIVDAIVDNSSFYKNKPIWKQKFYHLCDYITQQNFNNELRIADEYVNIHEETMARILGVDNRQMATILKHCVNDRLLKRDGKMRPAIKTKVGNKIVYLSEGKSFGYQFVKEDDIKEIEVTAGRDNEHRFIENRWEHTGKLIPKLELYRHILSSIKIDISEINETLSEILINKQRKKNLRMEYRKFIETIEKNFKQDFIQSTYNIPFDGVIVPKAVSKAAYSYLHEFKDGVIVPTSLTVKTVACFPCIFNLTGFQKKKRKVKQRTNESDATTVARCNRALYHINNGLMIPSRENATSRVYTTITNLNREFRDSILLDGKKIVGLDIANSQPLLATILIKRYWEKLGVHIPVDVSDYQRDCERGEFYENFMQELHVPPDLRSEFKKDFFSKVFFSMVIEENNILKHMFIKKYPSCWEAICAIKGGVYNEEYNEFAILLQEFEAEIIFDTVNVGLMDMGIKAFNIFDSIYVNNTEDFNIAKKMTLNAFATFGLTPTIRLEHGEHLSDEATMVQTNEGHTKNGNQKKGMKKKYTVDGLLSPSKTKDANQSGGCKEPTKLQHLKLETEEELRMKQINKLWLGYQDEEIEPIEPKRKVMSEKQIYDFVVSELKAAGLPVNKGNVDYLTKVAREELGMIEKTK